MKRKFGRYYIADNRDKLLARPRRKSKRNSRHWSLGPVLDQLDTSACVGFTGAAYFAASPIKQRVCDPHGLYVFAKFADEWEGEDYEGTSVRGLLKVCHRAGWISEYRFTIDIEVMVQHLLEKGPVILGSDWKSSMFEPDDQGFIHASGGNVGGHAYLAYGVNTSRGYVSIRNSWGADWGSNGTAKLSLDDLSKLLAADGECAVATEVRL